MANEQPSEIESEFSSEAEETQSNGSRTIAPPTEPMVESPPTEAPRPAPAEKLITEHVRYERQVPISSVPGYQAPKQRTPVFKESEVTKSDREFLDDLMYNPLAARWQLSIHRYQPSVNRNGEPLKLGKIDQCPIMPLDSLREFLLENWGGSEYRIIVSDDKGEEITGNRNLRCVVIKIDHKQFPAKSERGEKTGVEPVLQEEGSSDMVERRRAHKERLEIAKMKKQEAEADRDERRSRLDAMRFDMEERQLQQLSVIGEKKDDSIDKKIELLRLEAKADREAADARAKADREAMMTMMTNLITSMKPAPAAPNTDLKDMVVAFNNSQTQLINTMLTMNKKDDGGDKLSDAIKASQQSVERTAELVLKAQGKENTQQNQIFTAMINKLLSGDSSNPTDTAIRLMELGEKRLERALNLAKNLDSGSPESLPISPGDAKRHWVEKIFDGLIEVTKVATSNPQVMELLYRIVGTRNPSRAQLQQAAQNLAQQNTVAAQLPPPLIPVAQVQQFVPQQQQQLVQPRQAHSPAAELPPNIITPPPPPAHQAVQQQQPTPPLKPAQPVSATQVQKAVDEATKADNEIVGVNIEEMARQAGEVQAPQPAPTPSQDPINVSLVDNKPAQPQGQVAQNPAQVAQQQAQPAQSQPVQTQAADPANDTPEGRLRYFVTDSIKQCIADLIDKRNTRDWYVDAHQYWNGQFLRAIVEASSREIRVNMIASYCDGQVWGQLHELLSKDTNELILFYQGVDLLVQIVKNPPQPQQQE